MEEFKVGNYCSLCGQEFVDGKCPTNHHFKQMCLNCEYCKWENNELVCCNEENALNAIEKMKDAAKKVVGSYDIINLEVKPLPLKKPELKCSQWALSEDMIGKIVGLFK